MMSARRLVPLLVATASLAAPVRAQGPPKVRIVQTNSAGDQVHLIDPATNKVSDVIMGIQIPHGVAPAPDGSVLYITDEHDETLDVVPTSTLTVRTRIPLTNHPNNVAITPDGTKVYVAIAGAPFVDIIDTRQEKRVGRIPMLSGVHNVYVTPDGKYAVAGMIPASTMTVIDTQTDRPVWSLHFDSGVRPIAFERNLDGSTKRAFVQISGFNGFLVVDWATRSIVEKIAQPEVPFSQQSNDALQDSPAHGFAVSPDGTQLWSSSKPGGYVYLYSLPDLKLVGGVKVGNDPDWLTMTPDGRFMYVANAGSNDVSVIDTHAMTQIALIPVGQVPKRNNTVVIR
jgi:YVTN family beta-propeller protein